MIHLRITIEIVDDEFDLVEGTDSNDVILSGTNLDHMLTEQAEMTELIERTIQA